MYVCVCVRVSVCVCVCACAYTCIKCCTIAAKGDSYYCVCVRVHVHVRVHNVHYMLYNLMQRVTNIIRPIPSLNP